MNKNTFPRRIVPAVAVIALAVGLGACQTPSRVDVVPEAPSGPVVRQHVDRPAGVEMYLPADRIEEQLAREARLAREAEGPVLGTWTNRILAQIEYEKTHPAGPSLQFNGMTADRLEKEMQRGGMGPAK
jgi:hypothetical protein